MGQIFEGLEPIAKMAAFYFERSKVIQGNIANADTPFYKPRDLVFEKELEETLKLKKTDPRHIDPSGGGENYRVVELNDVNGYDGNKVNLDKELAKLAETALMTRALNEVLRKEIGKLKLSILGR